MARAAQTGSARLTGAGVWLVVEGRGDGAVSSSLSPNREPPDDVITLALDPLPALLGEQRLRPLDQRRSDSLARPGPRRFPERAQHAGRHTVVARTGGAYARLFLPRGVPFLGGHAVDATFRWGSRRPRESISSSTRTSPRRASGRALVSASSAATPPRAVSRASSRPWLRW